MSAAVPADGHEGLKRRVVSSLILVPVAIALILYGGMPFTAFVLIVGLIALYEFLTLLQDRPHRALLALAGTVYLAVCFASFLLLRFSFEQGAWLALSLVLSMSASDSCAYFAGKSIGGPRMAPRVSPNKTWAGLGGAVAGGALALTVFDALASLGQGSFFASVGTAQAVAAGAVLGGVGQVGDLLKSFFKRRAGVKDSGHLIPGHGGVLDRIDSLMLASPVFLIMVVLCL